MEDYYSETTWQVTSPGPSSSSSSSTGTSADYWSYEDFSSFYNQEAQDVKPTTTATKWQRKRAYEMTLPLHIRQKRRLDANARERKRMTSLNTAFQKLRAILPNHHRDKPLSKMEALQLAQNYIKELSASLHVNAGQAEHDVTSSCQPADNFVDHYYNDQQQ